MQKRGEVENVKQIANRIFLLESSGGKNDGCKAQGKYNGYGYGQNSFQHVCYASQKEVRVKVENWVAQKQQQGYSLAELLCYYNRGEKVSSCQYYKNYLTID